MLGNPLHHLPRRLFFLSVNLYSHWAVQSRLATPLTPQNLLKSYMNIHRDEAASPRPKCWSAEGASCPSPPHLDTCPMPLLLKGIARPSCVSQRQTKRALKQPRPFLPMNTKAVVPNSFYPVCGPLPNFKNFQGPPPNALAGQGGGQDII